MIVVRVSKVVPLIINFKVRLVIIIVLAEIARIIILILKNVIWNLNNSRFRSLRVKKKDIFIIIILIMINNNN